MTKMGGLGPGCFRAAISLTGLSFKSWKGADRVIVNAKPLCSLQQRERARLAVRVKSDRWLEPRHL